MSRMKMLLVLLLAIPLWGTAQNTMPKNIPVTVSESIVADNDDKNLISFSRDRPLEIADFRGRPDPSSNGVAATYSGISMEMKASAKNNLMQVEVILKVYFDKSKSWAKKEGKNDRVLAHEQHHFNLTAIKACELARAISAANYKSENAMEQLRKLQQQYTKELNELQNQYDRETKHGTLDDEQAQWATRIKNELAKATCF